MKFVRVINHFALFNGKTLFSITICLFAVCNILQFVFFTFDFKPTQNLLLSNVWNLRISFLSLLVGCFFFCWELLLLSKMWLELIWCLSDSGYLYTESPIEPRSIYYYHRHLCYFFGFIQSFLLYFFFWVEGPTVSAAHSIASIVSCRHTSVPLPFSIFTNGQRVVVRWTHLFWHLKKKHSFWYQ